MGQINDRIGERRTPTLVIMRPAELVISDLISLRLQDVPEAVILGKKAITFETSGFEVEWNRMHKSFHIFACKPTRFRTRKRLSFEIPGPGIPLISARLRQDIAKHFWVP